MSKYDELVNALNNSGERQRKYKMECACFFNDFLNAFAAHLNCDRKHVRAYPFKEPLQPDTYHHPISIMKMNEDNGFYDLEIAITLGQGYVQFPLSLKRLDNIYTLILPNGTCDVPATTEPNFQPACDLLFQGLLDTFQNNFDTFLRKGGKGSPIGFHTIAAT